MKSFIGLILLFVLVSSQVLAQSSDSAGWCEYEMDTFGSQLIVDSLEASGQINLDGLIPHKLNMRPSSCTNLNISPMKCHICNTSNSLAVTQKNYSYSRNPLAIISEKCSLILREAVECKPIISKRCPRGQRNTSSCQLSNPRCPIGSSEVGGVVISKEEMGICLFEKKESEAISFRVGSQLELTCQQASQVPFSNLSTNSRGVFRRSCQRRDGINNSGSNGDQSGSQL